MKKPASEEVTFSFQPGEHRLPRTAQVRLAVARDSESATVPRTDMVLMAGLGNEGRVAHVAANRLTGLGRTGIAVVNGLPFWATDPDGPGFTHMVVAATQAVHEHITQGEGGIVHVAGESQAAFSALTAAKELPEHYNGRVAALRPLGLQGDISKWEFVRRMMGNGLERDVLKDPLTPLIATNALRRVAGDAVMKHGRQLAYALEWDALPVIDELIEDGRDVAVFVGDTDRVFPEEEVRRGLGAHEAIVQTLPGPHVSLASKVGAQQAAQVADWLRQAAE